MKTSVILHPLSAIRLYCVVNLIVLSANCALAETVLLKSGKSVDGTITEENDKFIRIDPGIGMSVTYYRDEIKEISQEGKTTKKHFMWEVRSASNSVFILGSINLGNAQFFPLDKPIEDAFSQSAFLVVELDSEHSDPALLQKTLLARAAYQNGQQLRDYVSAELLMSLGKFSSRYDLDLAQLNNFKPWFIAMNLTMAQLKKLGLNEEYGIDRYFLKKVSESQKIIALETLDEQISMFDSLQDQDLLLRYILHDLEETENMLNYITSAWQNGDAAMMEKITITDGLTKYPDTAPVYEKLLFERSQRMAQKISEYLKTDQTYFVVVGAAHLLGDKGMIEILKKQGYTVNQM